MAMTIVPSDEQMVKLNKLSILCDHIQDISRKISELTNDPLPGQLEQSIPGYNGILVLHSDMLKRRRWTFVVAGDSSLAKSTFLNSVLEMPAEEGLQLQDILLMCHRCPVTINHGGSVDQHRFLVSIDGPGICDPVTLENWETLKKFIQQIQDGSDQTTVAWIVMQLDSKILKEDVELVVYPEEVTERNLEQLLDALSNSDVLLYVADKDNLDSTEKFQLFTSEMKSLRLLHHQLQPLVMMNCCLTILVSCRQASDSGGKGDKGSRNIGIWLLDDMSSSASPSHSSNSALNGDKNSLPAIITAMTRTLSSSIESRMLFHYGWLNLYVSRVLHHLKSFLSQAERSHEGRLETYKDILARLTALTERSEAFLIALQMEVDSKHKEGVTLLRNHLTMEEVTERLCTWAEEETPDEELWSDVDSVIRQKIQQRIHHEILAWEHKTKFFEVQRPHLIQLFEYRFRGIKTRLSSVESMISRHDSHLKISDDESSPLHSSRSSTTDDTGLLLPLMLPFSISLHWTQKLAIGLAAPLLIPLAFAAAILGLPIIGGLAAKEFVSERRSESKIKEYKTNKSAYLHKRTKDALKAFVKSTDLDKFVQSQLGAACQCIDQLRQEVPRQIEADRLQIISLRDDDRETTDLERFYQPLLEVFEHCRLLLLAYRVLHVKRDKLEVDFDEFYIPESLSGQVICDGLSGRIFSAHWTPKQSKTFESQADRATQTVQHDSKKVALKHVAHKLDAKCVEDYLMEEEAYRFQACPNIAKLLAITKTKGQLYHVLEPIEASLRQHLAQAPELVPPSSNKLKLTYLRRILLQMLRGLDYLHDRGWVHFDLSLDSLGVGCDGNIKLTNISCRKMFVVPRDVSTSGLLRFTHLPPEVLEHPPAAYTPSAEMYSVGIAMYEMWTGEHAYWRDICSNAGENPSQQLTSSGIINSSGDEPAAESNVFSSVDKFLAYVETHRPTIRLFRPNEASHNDAREEEHTVWSDLMQRCWTEGERITCKALLQLVEGSEGQSTFPIEESYFDRG